MICRENIQRDRTSLNSKYVKFYTVFNAVALFALLVLISACARIPGEIKNILPVDVPMIEQSTKLEVAEIKRKKVRKLDVYASHKDDILFAKGLQINTYYTSYGTRSPLSSQKVYNTYVLKNDLEPIARQGLESIFEIDPNADEVARVIVTARVHTSLGQNFWCKYWDTATNVEMDIVTLRNEKISSKLRYYDDEEETFCATSGRFPSASDIGENVRTALLKVIQKVSQNKGVPYEGKSRAFVRMKPTAKVMRVSGGNSTFKNKPVVITDDDSADKIICRIMKAGNAAVKKEAKRRELTPERCKKLLGG
jgi:hypothetical protein